MRKHLRLSVLALAAMFAGGAYAQSPESIGLSDDDNLLKNVTPDNVNEHLWMFGWDDEIDDPDAAAEDQGPDSQAEKNRMWKLLDGDWGNYVSSDWARAEIDPGFQQFLDVYLDEKVQGPMLAWIKRRADNDNGHVTEMDVWASDGSAKKHGLIGDDRHTANGDFAGWEKIGHVKVSNGVKGQDALTDIFTIEKPAKYFRFVFTKANAESDNSTHMAEFKLFNLSKDQVAFINLSAVYANYATYLENEPGNGFGTDYYQYADEESFKSFRATLEKIRDIVEKSTPVTEQEADALKASLESDWQKVQDSKKLFNVPEAGYYRIEFVKKPGYCAFANSLYESICVGKDDANDARQLWYMDPIANGKTLCRNAADGSYPCVLAGNPRHQQSYTNHVLTQYYLGSSNVDPSALACSFDYLKVGNNENGLPIVGMRIGGSPCYIDDVIAEDKYGSYLSTNTISAAGDTEDSYVANCIKYTDSDADQLVLVRVDDAEAEKIIANSSYTYYNQLQDLIYQANDLLDIAADAANCFSNDFNGGLLKDCGGQYSNDDSNLCAPKRHFKFDVDLGSQVSGGVKMKMTYEDIGYGWTPVEWVVYGSNDNAEWTLLDPCFNNINFNGTNEFYSLPLNLGKDGYRYLRFVCQLSWSDDDWQWARQTFRLSNVSVYKAERKSTAQIENEASQTLLAAVQAALDITGDKASQADVETLQKAIEDYKKDLADPTALRKLLAQTQYLAEGADFTGEEPGFFTEESGSDFDAAWKAANEFANGGMYTQEQIEGYIEELTVLKAEVEDAAIKVDPNSWYLLNFMDKDTYDIFANDWSGAACSDNSGNLFGMWINAESTEEGAKFVFDAAYDEAENSRSYFRFIENGDTYAILNAASGLYLGIVNGQPRLSATPTYFSVTPVGYGLVTITTAECALSADLASKSLSTAADANCNTNGAFFITWADEAEPFDAIQKVEAGNFKAGAIYSIDGKQVNDNFKGVVIKNGSKFLNK